MSSQPNLADLVPTAEALARLKHAGQRDKQGRDYADHHLAPVAALLVPFGPEAVAAGWLHDVIEDTETTEDDLRAAGMTEVVCQAVRAVTRRADEEYGDLISRAAADPLGRIVKLMDNWVNLTGSEDLAQVDPAAAARLKGRYEDARRVLLAGLGVTS